MDVFTFFFEYAQPPRVVCFFLKFKSGTSACILHYCLSPDLVLFWVTHTTQNGDGILSCRCFRVLLQNQWNVWTRKVFPTQEYGLLSKSLKWSRALKFSFQERKTVHFDRLPMFSKWSCFGGGPFENPSGVILEDQNGHVEWTSCFVIFDFIK